MNLSGFDLNLLRVLDAMLRERSTVRAGERIGLSQPATSAALGRLRAALGDPLFIRQGQGLVPTDFARSLETPLRRALDDLEAALFAHDSFDPALAHFDYRISGTDFFAEMLMPKLADELARRAPGVRVQLVDLVPDDYVNTIDRFEVDLALLPGTELPHWIDGEPVFHSSFIMIARAGHPRLRAEGIAPGARVPLDLFCELLHVLFSPAGHFGAMGDAALARLGRTRRVVMTVPVFSGVVRAVSGSDLVALFPQQMARALAEQFDLELYQAPIDIPVPLIWMIWHRRATGNPAQRWMRDLVRDILGPLNAGEAPLPDPADCP
jgi:DNA-binding transcriptional LysR family regulator